MPLMGSLYVGASGLVTSQNALNTTAHNLSNINTTGYTRQQILLGDYSYNKLPTASKTTTGQVGIGVYYSKVRQVRDYFLDQTYRTESGRSSFYEVSYNTMGEVENVLGELYGTTFSDSLNDLWESVQELANNPADDTNQNLFVKRAQAFLESATSVYDGLSNYQDNLNLQVKSQVDQINETGQKIYDLNNQILKIESGGVESANDLRDARNQLLDELSSMVKMSYKENKDGVVSVQIEGNDFVTASSFYNMDVYTDNSTGFYTPYWPQNATYTTDMSGNTVVNITGAEVFNVSQEVSLEANTDVGGLKALLMARGDRRADYTDLTASDYDSTVSQSVIMNVEAEFDQLIHAVTTQINGVLANAADTTTGYMCESVDVGGTTTYKPIQLFQKIESEGYTYNAGTGKWDYANENTSDDSSLYTIKNMTINSELLKEPTKLKFYTSDGEDRTTASALAALFDKEGLTLNPNVTTAANFSDYYSNLVSQIGTSGSVYYSIMESQQTTLEAVDYSRDEVVGVSSDDELSYMIKYQNAFNAASRYFNVVNDMLDTLLNSMT